MADRQQTPHVVIIGGGFAGLYLARGLARAPVRVTIIDRKNHHLFQPMLYQVASAALNPSEIAVPIRSVLRNQRNADVLMGVVSRIDVEGKQIELEGDGSISYDYLVVATGIETSYYGKDRWEPLAPGLKDIEDALSVRERVLRAFEEAEREKDPVRRHALLTFVVVGGGPTGVEMAGAIAELRRYALARDFRHIDPREATVMLLEGGPKILPSYPDDLSATAKHELRGLGVEVRTEMLVNDIQPGYVKAAGWTIPTNTVVWAAGMKGTSLLATLGAPLDRMGRVIVEKDCSVPGHPEVFVLGDAAHFEDEKFGDVLPPIAQPAIQQGKHTAKNIVADLKQKPRKPFVYFDKGQLAVIGRGQAVADIWKFHFGGFLAWMIWAVVHIAFLVGHRNRVIVMLQWWWAYTTFHRGARLITGRDHIPSGMTFPTPDRPVTATPPPQRVSVA
ncbi:MAG TPA: NAD(P)/FAD-dependent oxidoreductase [Gemmatimonadales bacterium]|nr:NAD(P)/FAD-dependent oxidoreductase [Gemmatimonadales bacterium]